MKIARASVHNFDNHWRCARAGILKTPNMHRAPKRRGFGGTFKINFCSCVHQVEKYFLYLESSRSNEDDLGVFLQIQNRFSLPLNPDAAYMLRVVGTNRITSAYRYGVRHVFASVLLAPKQSCAGKVQWLTLVTLFDWSHELVASAVSGLEVKHSTYSEKTNLEKDHGSPETDGGPLALFVLCY